MMTAATLFADVGMVACAGVLLVAALLLAADGERRKAAGLAVVGIAALVWPLVDLYHMLTGGA